MRNLTDIKLRIKSITETRQITGAMETISIAKMRKALLLYESNHKYFAATRSVMCDIVLHSGHVRHRYMDKRGGESAVYIVIASDKGLAGGYNHNVLNAAWDAISAKKERFIFTLGQVAREFFEKRKIPIDIDFTYTTKDPTIYDVEHIVENIVSLYDQGMMDEVYVIYTSLLNSTTVMPAIIQLLPLRTESISEAEQEAYKPDEYYRELRYDPTPDEVLDELVPQYLAGLIYGALVQSVAAEHSCRRLAMSNATKNADEIVEKLTLDYHRARQEVITNEITELVTASVR
ncbi:MAG: ATP synthase F1 subunit gamma [Firmicutes bacterium]|nr:ATP synthase F1 subunit gamma [Bacillota bacterium]